MTGCGTLSLRTAGPVGLPRPALTWCLGLPQISALLQQRSLRSRVTVAAVGGGLAGFAAMIALWPVSGWMAGLLPIVGPLMGAALVFVTAAEQAQAPTEGRNRRTARLATTRALGLVAVVMGLLTWYLASYDVIAAGRGMALPLVGALVLAVLAGGLGRWSSVREAMGTGGIPLGELHRAGEVVDRLSASVAMMTTSLLEPTPRRRRPIRLTATAGVTRGWAGWLAMLDIRRVLARWPQLVVAACLAPLVGSVTRVAGRDWGCVVLTLLAYALASRLARWFFAWNASPSLKFLVPFSDSSTTVALLAAPVLGVLMFSTAAVGLAGLSPWWIASSLVCPRRDPAPGRRSGQRRGLRPCDIHADGACAPQPGTATHVGLGCRRTWRTTEFCPAGRNRAAHHLDRGSVLRRMGESTEGVGPQATSFAIRSEPSPGSCGTTSELAHLLTCSRIPSGCLAPCFSGSRKQKPRSPRVSTWPIS
jgi:Family of unknown function (DUF6297)